MPVIKCCSWSFPLLVVAFNLSILEVKLNCETTPPWIAGILANSQVVLERNKFSKFLTGIAYHHYEKIPELPYWFRDELALDPRNRFLSIEERERLLRKGADDDDDEDENRSLKPNKSSKALMVSPSSRPNVHFGTAPSLNSPGTLVVPHSSSVSMPTSATERTPLLLENESDHTLVDTPRSSTSFLSSLRRRLTPSNPFSRVRTDLKPIRSNARIKIEPKTSFANERTLIQWVSAASLMITLGTLIVTSGSEFGFKAGFVFFPLAFLIMLYAR